MTSAWAIATFLAGLSLAGPAPAAPPTRTYACRCVFRVNTTVSSGKLSPEEVARKAEEGGVKALVISDQFLSRAVWGVPGFRGLLKFTKEKPSVLTHGVDRYLAGLSKLQEDHPGLIVVGALDVAPYYYWQGNPFWGEFTVNQWSAQWTVLGLDSPEVIRRMPVVANPHAPKRWTVMSFVRLTPLLLVLLGALLMRRRGIEYSDEQGDRIAVSRSPWRVVGVVAVVVGVLLVVSGYPYAEGIEWDSHRPTDGPEPYRAYGRWLARQPGALAFWSAPEATHKEVIEGVTFMTRPSLDHVFDVPGLHGFAGLYGDAHTACDPGGAWDEALQEYCQGKRDRPLVIVGERDYHGEGPIDLIETVLILTRVDREHLIEEGFRKGYAYARSRGPGGRVELTDFSASAPKGPRNMMFRPLTTDSEAVLRIEAKVLREEPRPDVIRFTLVSGGRVVFEESLSVKDGGKARTYAKELRVKLPVGEPMRYFRLIVDSKRTGRLLTNPVFVHRREGAP